jgi:hypothetical protein
MKKGGGRRKKERGKNLEGSFLKAGPTVRFLLLGLRVEVAGQTHSLRVGAAMGIFLIAPQSPLASHFI